METVTKVKLNCSFGLEITFKDRGTVIIYAEEWENRKGMWEISDTEPENMKVTKKMEEIITKELQDRLLLDFG